MDKESIVIVYNNGFGEMKELFKLLSTNNKGKLTGSHYICPTGFNVKQGNGIEPQVVAKFNTILGKSRNEGFSNVLFSFNIKQDENSK